MADEGVGIQSVEDFWGVELSSKKKKVLWPLEPDDEVEDDLEKTLELRQACLGAKAKEGERNVVQLTAENEEGEEVTHTILSMRVGGAEQTQLFLTLQPPVTFELVSGNGPVHIVGTLNQTLTPFLSDDESSSEDEEEEKSKEEVLKRKVAVSKKRPAPSPAQKPAKVPKLAPKEEDSDEEDSDEEDSEDEEGFEEEDSMETELAAASRDVQQAKSKAKQVKGAPKQQEEEESDEEEEESDEEDSEEEEEESEESEEEQPPAKKPQVNGQLKGKPAKPASKKPVEKGKPQAKTPQPNKALSKAIISKGSQSAPTTPKAGGGDKTKKVAPNIQEIKQKLLKMSPNIPKKIDKFNNFVSNSFKVLDSSVKKQLWEFVQKNRPEK